MSQESHLVIERVRRHIEQTHFGISNEEKEETETKRVGVEKDNGSNTIESTCSTNHKVNWLPVHAIHLKEKGILSPHVDSVKFSGGIVAGISLLSTSIMRLKPASPSELASSTSSLNYGNEKSEELNEKKRENNEENNQLNQKCLENAGHVDLFLPPLSLYVLSDMSRYKYTHEILESGSCFINEKDGDKIMVHRDDRISIIFRDSKS